MAFRDDREALRAHVQKLEIELREALERAEALEDDAEERDQLAVRVKELEQKLGIEKEKEERERRREELRKEAERAREQREETKEKAGKPLSARLAPFLLPVGIVAFIGFIVMMATGAWTRLLVDTDGAPSIGLIDLERTPSPVPVTTELGGGWSAESFGDCRGYVPRTPQLVLRTHRPMALRISTQNATPGDAVMLVHTSAGDWLCNDDGGDGSNPSILSVSPPGDTRVYVGTYQEDAHFSVSIEVQAHGVDAIPDPTGLATRATPALGTRTLGEGEVLRLPTHASGIRAAEEVQAGCRGFVSLAPTLRLRTQRDQLYRFTTEATADLVMLTRDAQGAIRCDDDGGYSNSPLIAGNFPPGEVGIWVGVYSRETEVDATLVVERMAVHGPLDRYGLTPTAPATYGSSSVAAGVPIFLTGRTEGTVSAQQIHQSCYGDLPMEPSFSLVLGGPLDVTVEGLSVAGGGPAQLVFAARHPDGSYVCGQGDHPLRGSWQAGTHQLWVGTRASQPGQDYQLRVQATPPSVMPWRE